MALSIYSHRHYRGTGRVRCHGSCHPRPTTTGFQCEFSTNTTECITKSFKSTPVLGTPHFSSLVRFVKKVVGVERENRGAEGERCDVHRNVQLKAHLFNIAYAAQSRVIPALRITFQLHMARYKYVIHHTVFLAIDGDTDMKTSSCHQSRKLIPIESVSSNSQRFHSQVCVTDLKSCKLHNVGAAFSCNYRQPILYCRPSILARSRRSR